MKVAELFAELGFNVDNEGLNTFIGGLRGAATRATIVTAAVTAAAFAVNKFADASIRASAALRAFTIETGLNNQKLQQWQVITQLTDIDATAQDVTSSIQALQSNLAQIRLGQGNIRPFQLLGISAYGDAFDVIEQLRGAIQGLDPAMAVNLLQEMGLGPEFYHVLRLSREEFDSLSRSYLLSSEQVSSLTAIGSAFNDLGMFIQHARDEFVAFASPLLIKAAHAIEAAIRLLIAPFEVLGLYIHNAGQALDRFMRTINGGAISSLESLKIVLIGIGVAMFPITAGILGLLLILEDIAVYARGGESAIGDLVEFLKSVDIFGSIADQWNNLTDVISETMGEWQEFIERSFIKPITDLKKIIESVPDGVGGFFSDTTDAIGGAIGDVGRNVSNTFSNIFNIQSDDPVGTADAVTNSLQRQLDFGLSDLNNAGAY